MTHRPLFNVGQLRDAIRGMRDDATVLVTIQQMGVPIEKVVPAERHAGEPASMTVFLDLDLAWLNRAMERAYGTRRSTVPEADAALHPEASAHEDGRKE